MKEFLSNLTFWLFLSVGVQMLKPLILKLFDYFKKLIDKLNKVGEEQ